MYRTMCLLSLVALTPTGFADQLVMKDGQVLNGRLISKDSIKIVFTNEHGTMNFPINRVDKIVQATDEQNISYKFYELLKVDAEKAQVFVNQYSQEPDFDRVLAAKLQTEVYFYQSKQVTERLIELEKQISANPDAAANSLDKLIPEIGAWDTTNTLFASKVASSAHLKSALSALDKADSRMCASHARAAFEYEQSIEAIDLMQKTLGDYSHVVEDSYVKKLNKDKSPQTALAYSEFLFRQRNLKKSYKILTQYVTLSPESPPNVRLLYSKVLSQFTNNYEFMAEAGISESDVLRQMQIVSPGYQQERLLSIQFNKNPADSKITRDYIGYLCQQERYIDSFGILSSHEARSNTDSLADVKSQLLPFVALEKRKILAEDQLSNTLDRLRVIYTYASEKVPSRIYMGTDSLVTINSRRDTGIYVGGDSVLATRREKDTGSVYSKDNYTIVWNPRNPERSAELKEALSGEPTRNQFIKLEDYIAAVDQYVQKLELAIIGRDQLARNLVDSQAINIIDNQTTPIRNEDTMTPSLENNN